MPTTLTTVLMAAYSEGIADIGAEAVDNANGNDFVNTGNEVLIVTNGSGGGLTATITSASGDRTYGETITKDIGPANGDTGIYGPFPVSVFGAQPVLAWSTGTSVTCAVVRLANAA